MHKHRIELKEGVSLVVISGEGSLTIRGHEEPILLIEVPEETDPAIEQGGGRVILRLEQDAHLWIWREMPLIVRELAGDLTVRELEAALEISEVKGDVNLRQVGDSRLGQVEGDVIVTEGGAVQAEGFLKDDVVLRGVGAVELDEVGADLVVRGAASLGVNHVRDDLVAHSIGGAVRLTEARGDVSLRGVDGAVEIARVQGDFSGRALHGDVRVTRVDGDTLLHVAFQEGRQYRLAGEREIAVRFPEETGARFVIEASSWVHPPVEGYQVESEEEGRAVIVVGKGGPDVYLTTDGEVVLGRRTVHWEQNLHEVGQRMEAWADEFGNRMQRWGDEVRRRVDWERIGQEVEQAVSNVGRLVETRLQEIEDRWDVRGPVDAEETEEEVRRSVDWERIGRKVEDAARRSVSKVRTNLQRLQERLRQKAERVEVEGERATRVDIEITEEPLPAQTTDSLDEERLAVLRMVEEGRLTSKEASALLEALEA
jgi:hypothetical protein